MIQKEVKEKKKKNNNFETSKGIWMDEDDGKSYQSLTDVSHWLLITVVSKKGRRRKEEKMIV